MATEEPGIKPVVLYVNGEAVSTLNPLPATGGGGGGGGGIVDQGVGSGLPTGAWTVRISNGSGFLAPLTKAACVLSSTPHCRRPWIGNMSIRHHRRPSMRYRQV